MGTQIFGRELSNREFFIQRWHQEHSAFVGVIRSLPTDCLDYRPHPRSRSAAELVAVLITGQQNCIQLCESKDSSYSGMHWQEPSTLVDRGRIVATYERDYENLAFQLRSLDDSEWNHQAWLLKGDKDILLKDTVGGLLWIALFDTVHHRGQLSTYIRPMGGKVPSIYGPSADDLAQWR
jgi:uncharacterized damage-inducible protein DinB